MGDQFGFLPFPNPAAAWPARMSVEEGRERGEGRMRVGAQSRPLQRGSLGIVFSRSGERRKPCNVALGVQDRGLEN